MPLYTLAVTVQLATATRDEAISDIRLALAKSKRAEILVTDYDVIGAQPDEIDQEPSAAELSAAYSKVCRVVNGGRA